MEDISNFHLDEPDLMESEDTEKCVTLGTNNATFCGVSNTWESRWLTGDDLTRTAVGPTLVAAVIYGAVIIYMIHKFRKSYRSFTAHIGSFPADTDILGLGQKILACLSSRETALKMAFVIFFFISPVAFMVFDCVDVLFDLQYFFKLETKTGNLLDNHIMRNKRVNDAILAFAILGFVKIVLIGLFNGATANETRKRFHKLSNSPHENSKILEECKEELATMSTSATSLTALIFEDGGELFLEYFYVDKYAKSDWLVLVNSTMMAVVDGLVLIFGLKEFFTRLWRVVSKRNDETSQNDIIYLFMTFPVQLITISEVLRAVACWEQAYTGIIPEECLVVEDGALIQTPFSSGCLSKIDYGILTFTILSGISVLGQIVLLIIAFKWG